jgi:hypothetical protein
MNRQTFYMKGVVAEAGSGGLLSFKHRGHLSCRSQMACRESVVEGEVWSVNLNSRCHMVSTIRRGSQATRRSSLGEVTLKELVNERRRAC